MDKLDFSGEQGTWNQLVWSIQDSSESILEHNMFPDRQSEWRKKTNKPMKEKALGLWKTTY